MFVVWYMLESVSLNANCHALLLAYAPIVAVSTGLPLIPSLPRVGVGVEWVEIFRGRAKFSKLPTPLPLQKMVIFAQTLGKIQDKHSAFLGNFDLLTGVGPTLGGWPVDALVHESGVSVVIKYLHYISSS